MKIISILFLPLLLIQNGWGGITSDPKYAEEIIKSFNGLCPTNGDWTLKSLSESRKIQKILIDLRDNPNCSNTAMSVSTHINSLTAALERAKSTRIIEQSLSGRQRQQVDILLLLEDENNQSTRQSLEEVYRNNQLDLALDQGRLQYDKNYARNQYMANVIVDSTAKIFQQMALNQRCLLQAPQAVFAISSIGSSLASALLMGELSLGLAAISNLLGYVFEFFRKSKLNDHIERLGRGEFISAYQCVLESLSNQWCEARETYSLIKLKTTGQGPDEDNDPFQKGIRILNRDLPVLTSWIKKVSSATLTENSAMAASQIRFLTRNNMLRLWMIESLGKLGDAKTRLPKSLLKEEEREVQFNILKDLINLIIPDYTEYSEEEEDGPPSPLYDVVSFSEIYWLLTGIPIDDIPLTKDHLGNLNLPFFGGFTPKIFREEESLISYYPLDPEKIKANILSLYDKADLQLNRQRNDVLHTDPASLFAQAEDEYYYVELDSVKNISPLTAIDNILAFLQYADGSGDRLCPPKNELSSSYHNNIEEIHNETKKILCQIKLQIQDISTNYEERLKIIFNIAHLHDGVTFINDRIENVVERIIKDILHKRGDEKAPDLQYKLLLADTVTRELKKYGHSNLTRVRFDIVNALKITENTLQNFAEIFSQGIAATFHQVYNDNHNNPFSERLLAKYCSLLLAIPNWNVKELEGIDLSLCEGRGLESEWQQGKRPFEFSFSSNMYHTPFDHNRTCHF